MFTENQNKAIEIGKTWLQSQVNDLEDLLKKAVEVEKLGYAKGSIHADNWYCHAFAEMMMNQVNCTTKMASRMGLLTWDEVRELERKFYDYLQENKSRLKTGTTYL
jgi:hypothetical protein